MKPKTRTFPTSPGVYLHKNVRGEIIYVGKAKNLRKRIASYTACVPRDNKTQALVASIASTDFIVTTSEVEALLLENRLIKKHRPKYNIELKDTHRYYYLGITNETFPRLIVTRKTNSKDRFFGPYTQSVHGIVKMAQTLFGLRACGKTVPKKACFYYHLGQCSGPCAGAISSDEYQKNVDEVVRFIRHGDESLRSEYEELMHQASRNQEYERALSYKRKIELLETLCRRQVVDVLGGRDQHAVSMVTAGRKAYITIIKVQRGVLHGKEEFVFYAHDDVYEEFIKTYYAKHMPPEQIVVEHAVDESISLFLQQMWNKNVRVFVPARGRVKQLLELAQKNAQSRAHGLPPVLIELQKLLRLSRLPRIIDCFDISNYGDQVIVGGCVQYKDGAPYKTNWRHYTVHISGQDDFRSMYEVVSRRYAKMDVPDVIVVDGGAAQVDFALQALAHLGLSCPVVGLAKREETIIFSDGSSVVLDRVKESSKLLIAMRDAVHNFSLSHSRKRLGHQYKNSVLDTIAGIGEKTKFALLAHFGSLEAIRRASRQELEHVVGVARATKIYTALHSTKN